MSKKLKKLILIHLLVLCIFTVYVLLPIKCPVNYFLNTNCPTCGMTRSLFALLRGNFAESFVLNPMTVPFILLLLFGFHKDLFKIKKRTSNIIITVGSVVIFVVFLIRLL